MAQEDKKIEEMDDKEFQELMVKYLENLEAIRNTSISDFFKGY